MGDFHRNKVLLECIFKHLFTTHLHFGGFWARFQTAALLIHFGALKNINWLITRFFSLFPHQRMLQLIAASKPQHNFNESVGTTLIQQYLLAQQLSWRRRWQRWQRRRCSEAHGLRRKSTCRRVLVFFHWAARQSEATWTWGAHAGGFSPFTLPTYYLMH